MTTRRSSPRPLIAQGVIVAALAGGSWLLVVEPRTRELQRLEAIIADAQSVPAGPPEAMVERMASRLVSIRGRVSEILARSEAGSDSARLYRTVMDQAQSNGVEVRSLSPASGAAPTSAGAATAAGSTAVRVELVVDGPYHSIAGLLEALQNGAAHVRLAGLTITPKNAGGSPLVTARVTFETLSFRVPEALASLQGDAHALR